MLQKAVILLLLLNFTTRGGSINAEIETLGPGRGCNTTYERVEKAFEDFVRGIDTCGIGNGDLLLSLFSEDIILFFLRNVMVGTDNLDGLSALCSIEPPQGFKSMRVESGTKTIVGNSVFYELKFSFTGFENYTVQGALAVCGEDIVRIVDTFDFGELIPSN